MMAVGMLVLLFVAGYAYDDEQSVLLQAGVKNHVNSTHTQAERTQCVDDPNYEDIDGDGCVGQYTNNPEGLCGIPGFEDSCCGCCATCQGTSKCKGVVCSTSGSETKPYHQTEKGADSCPGAALTSSECEAAAVHYGLPWDRADKWSNGLAGCFTNGQKVYFNTNQGAAPNPKWSLICQAPNPGDDDDDDNDDDDDDDDDDDYGGDDDYVEPTEPTCLEDKCYKKKNGRIKRRKCESNKNGCATCKECAEKPEDRRRCEDKCYGNDGAIKKGKCAKKQCAACAEC